MPRSIEELLARADEFADEFEAYEPQEAERGEPALMAVRRVAYKRSVVERELLEGASWEKIGTELGTSGEAARQRYGGMIDA